MQPGVSHQRLLRKVSSNGIKGSLLNWIKDFLTGRKQYVTVKGQSSEWEDVLSGVPQGSVLGPILFILYVNDFPDIIKSVLRIFADDAKIYQTTDKSDILQDDLQNSDSWADKWELEFSINKCGVMHYGKDNDNHSYKMNSKTLKVVHEETDLGIIFQDDLKFNKHISNKIQKANSMLGLIIRSFDYLDKNSYIKLYKAIVRPQLEYGNAVWHPYSRKDIESIEAVQKRFTRQIPGLKEMSYHDRLKHLKLPSLAHRRRRGDIIQCFKIIRGLDDIPCERFFTFAESRTRGHCYKLIKPRCETSFRLRSFSQRVISEWNNLPYEVATTKTLNSFKNKIDKLWNNEKMYSF